MSRFFKYIIPLAFIYFLSSCIKNDIPYPHSLGKILEFEVSGQIGEAVIDSTKCTVTVELADTVDISNVMVKRLEMSDNITSYTPELSTFISLDSAYVYELSTYPGQTYKWQITASQTIERFIKADNQVGKAEFNLDYHTAVFYVSGSLKNVKINEIQLGPSNSVITPDPRTLSDFSSRVSVIVSYRDISEEWTINAYTKAVEVTTTSVDAWSNHAFFYGSFAKGMSSPSFKYKKTSDSEWITVPSSAVVIDDVDMSAHVTGLTPNTTYEVKGIAGDSEGDVLSFTTEEAKQMPNMSFDEWCSVTIKGKNTWFPNVDFDANYWWDSGNQGANSLGEANPTSPEESFVVKGKASRMETISVIGQMAGGNVFSGKFVKTIIGAKVGAKVDFGRPFTTRPSKIHGYYSYEPKAITNVKSPYESLMGRPDRCHIFLMLFDSDKPYSVDTSEGIYLPPYTDDCVIGYADLVDSTSTGGKYKEFTIDVVYKDNRKPGYCALVAVASYYADYFTGGVGTLMYADEFEFIYDDKVVWEADLAQAK